MRPEQYLFLIYSTSVKSHFHSFFLLGLGNEPFFNKQKICALLFNNNQKVTVKKLRKWKKKKLTPIWKLEGCKRYAKMIPQQKMYANKMRIVICWDNIEPKKLHPSIDKKKETIAHKVYFAISRLIPIYIWCMVGYVVHYL